MDFEIMKREILHQGRILDLQRVQARLPNGHERTYELVDLNGSVTILPLDDEQNIWFVRQYRLGALQELLELPAGLLEGLEDPAEGALRELREEIGMTAKKMEKLGEFFLAPGYSNEFMCIFLATGLSAAPLPPDADEFIKIQKIPLGEVMAMVRRQEFHDGKTLAALMLGMPFLMPLSFD
jgi:ADP-ribose pyrophosphatase